MATELLLEAASPLREDCLSEEGTPPSPAGARLEAFREAARQAKAGEAAGRRKLFELVLPHQDWLIEKLRYYRFASWDLAHDAVIDMMIGIVEDASKGNLRLPAQERWLRRFLYRRAGRQFWINRRRAKGTREKRRGRKARRDKPVDSYLPRIKFHSWKYLEGLTNQSNEGNLDARDFLRRLQEVAAEKLTRRERTILFARLEKLGYREIAPLARTSPGAARVLHHKAVRKMRPSLETA
jgi:RNA polymerase sigma factor (sigma-70 family)